VLAFDKYRDNYGDQYATEETLAEIQRQADVLSLHIPLTQLTRDMVNAQFIAAFHKPFYLINISRGEIVNAKALVQAMKSGQVPGACLDVLENEKLSQLTNPQQEAFDYLRKSPRTVLTPHVAGWTHESYVRVNEVLVQQVAEWING
jgi:D-3-phosphoglycerate dehydrogenase